MRPLYTKFSLVFLFFFMLHANTPRAMVYLFDTELKPNKDKSKETSNPTKPRAEVGGKTDRPKKDETLPTPNKVKRKVLPISPLVLTEDVKMPSFTPLSLTGKGIQTITTNFNKNVGPDPFRFTISSNKDSVAVGEEIELTVTVDWVDYGVNNGVRFLPEWYKYVLRVVTPKGFLQTGGDYTDFCTKPVDANNPQAVFTIKGKFEYAHDEAKFMVLRGFEGSNVESEFIWKGEKSVKIIDGQEKKYYEYTPSYKSARIEGVAVCNTSGSIKVCVTRADSCNGKIIKVEGTITSTNTNNTDVYLYWHTGSCQCVIGCGDDTQISTNPGGKYIVSSSQSQTFSLLGSSTSTHLDIGIGGNLESNKAFGCNFGFRKAVEDVTPSKPTNLSAPKNATNWSLSGTCATGTIKWYANSNGTTAVIPPVSPTVSTTYYARCESGTCISGMESVGISICTATPPTNTSVSPTSVVSGRLTEITLGGNCATGSTLYWKQDDSQSWNLTSVKPSISSPTKFNFKCVHSDGCSSGNGDDKTVINACNNSTLKIGLNVTDASCNSSDGVIVAGGGDGVAPYEYYRNGAIGDYSSSSTFSGLSVGTYKIFVRDNNGCIASNDAVVNALGGPASPFPFAGDSKISANTITVTATCASGIVTWYRNSSGGSSIGTGGSFSEFITETKDYYVSCNTSGCASGREKVTAVISPDPCAVMSVSASNNSGNFNEGDGTNLVLQTPDCSGCTFVWTGPNGYYSTNRSSLITNPTWTTHNGVYTVYVSKTGCNTLSDNTLVILGEPLVNPQIINETPNNVTSFCGQGTFSLRATGCQDNSKVQWTVNAAIINNLATISNNISAYHIIKLQCKSVNGSTLVGPIKQIEFLVYPYSSCFDGNNIIVNKTPGGKTAFCTKGWIELYAQGCPDNNKISWYSNNPEINGGRFASVIRGTITKTTTIGYNCIDPTDNTKEFSWKQITFTVGAAGCNSPTPTLINNTTHQYDKFCGKGWVNLEVNGCPDNTKAKWYKNNTFVKEGIKFSEVINQTANYKVTCAGAALVAPNFAEITMQVFDFNECEIPSAVNLTPDGQTEFCGSGVMKLMMSGCGNTGSALYEEHLDDGTYSSPAIANNAGFVIDGIGLAVWDTVDGRNRRVLNYTALKSGYFKVICPDANGNPKWNTQQRVYFKVNKLPTVSATNIPACVNKQATLNAEIVTDIPNNIGDVKYTWTDATGQFISGSQTPSVLAANSTPTTYNVKFTDIKGCTATASTVVTNFALPVITVQPKFDVCQGSTINLNATASVGSGKIKVDFNLAENTGLTDRTITLNITGTPTPNTNTVTIIQKAKSATCVKAGNYVFTEGQLFGNQGSDTRHKTVIKIQNGCAKAWWYSTADNQTDFLVHQDHVNGLENLTIPRDSVKKYITFDGGSYNNCNNNTRCDIGNTTSITNFTSAGGAGSFEIDLPNINGSWAVNKANINDPITFTTESRPATPVNFTWFKNNLVQPMPINNAQSANGGVYDVTATDRRGCVGLASTTVNVILPVSVGISSNSTDGGTSQIETGDMLKVWANKVAGSSYQWMYSATDPTIGTGTVLTFPMTPPTNYSSVAPFDTIYKNNIQVSDNGFYKVKVTDQYGCINHGNVKVLIQPFQCKLTAQVTPTCYIQTNKRWAKMQVVVKNRTLNWRGFIRVTRVKDADSVAVVGEAPIIDTLWLSANTKNMSIGLRDKIPFGIYQVVMGEKRSDEESGPGFQCFPDTMKIMVDCRRKCEAPANYANCGKVPTPDLSQEIFKETLEIGESFFVGDFEIVVDAVSQTEPYTFKGKGYIKMPYLNFVKVQMDFDSAKINECKYLVAGAAKTVYDPNWGAVVNPGAAYDDAVKLYNDIKDLTKSLIDLNFGTLDERRAKAMAKQMIASDNDLPKKLVDEKNKNAAQLVDIQKKCNNGTFTPAQCTAAGDSLKKEQQALQDKIDKYKDDWVRIVTATLTQIQTTARANKTILLNTRNAKATVIDPAFNPASDGSLEKSLPNAIFAEGETVTSKITDAKTLDYYNAEIAYNESLIQDYFSEQVKSSRAEAIALAKRLRLAGNVQVMADYIYAELSKSPVTPDATIISTIKPIFLEDIKKILIQKVYSK